jgi:hypothetical protein
MCNNLNINTLQYKLNSCIKQKYHYHYLEKGGKKRESYPSTGCGGP